MKETITREGDIITIKRETAETIDIKKLQAEPAALETIAPPKDSEVLDMAKQGVVHPYYDLQKRAEKDVLKKEIEKWQKQ